jgi:hypothetical protein
LKTAALRLSLAAALVVTLVVMAGCGEEGANAPGIDAPLQGTIQVGPSAVNSMTLATTVAGDRFETTGATATMERADGTTEDVSLTPNADGTVLTLGQAAVTAPLDGGTQAPTQADVRVVARVQSTAPGSIDGVTLTTRDPGDTLDITGAKAHVERADGSSEAVNLTINGDGTEVTLGPFTVEPTPGGIWYWRLNRLVIEGPVSAKDGPTGSSTVIGSLTFSFGVDKADHVVVPEAVRACIPTIGVASDQRVVVEGLTPDHDYVWAAITDNQGGVTYSKAYMADQSGQAIIPDTLGQFTADRLSGPNSHIEMCFGSTYKRTPPPIYWPPVYDGAGPGGGDRSGLNILSIGPFSVAHAMAGGRTEIGRLRLGFEALADGTVIAPATFAFSVPLRGLARDQSVRVTGLQPGDFCQSRFVDNSGRVVRSPTIRADSGGGALIRDAQGGLPASAYSGPDSRISLFFARTDANGDGKPDWF